MPFKQSGNIISICTHLKLHYYKIIKVLYISVVVLSEKNARYTCYLLNVMLPSLETIFQ